MEKLYYITVATKPHIILDQIVDKVHSNNEKIHILGTQENRYIGWNAKGNFGIKLREVQKFLEKPELNNDDIVLFTDAYDVIYRGDQETIKKRFEKMNHPIIFGAETECNPDPSKTIQYKIRDEEFSYLNSGMFIGRVWALRTCMNDYKYNDQDDDQLFWTIKFLNNKNMIKLDYKNELFFNSYNMNNEFFDYDDNAIYYRDRTPQFLHVNGPIKDMLKYFIKK
tara:strand:+ start:2022 stop:2693 length:672 start_codon:yes stop_codon:yes gene_type:complete